MSATKVFPIPVGANNLTVQVRNFGASPVQQFFISYQIGNAAPVSQLINQTINSCDSALVQFTGPNQVVLNAGQNPMRIFTSQPNGQTDNIRENDTLIAQLATPLAGDYTVGGLNPDFESLNAAKRALETRGAIAPVRFLIRTGVYFESLELGPYPGMNTAGVTVKFQSQANNPDSVWVRSSSLGSIQPSTVRFLGNANNYLLESISFENVAVSTLSQNLLRSVVLFQNQNNRDTLRNCKFVAANFNATNNTALNGYTLFFQDAAGLGIAVQNCNLSGSVSGVNVQRNASNPLQDFLFKRDYCN